MSSSKLSDEVEWDAPAQFTDRGYRVREVAEWLGGVASSLFAWKKKSVQASSGDAEKDAEIRRLKKVLAQASEERDILRKEEACPPSVRGGWRVISPAFARGRASLTSPLSSTLCGLAEEHLQPPQARADQKTTVPNS